MDEKQSTGGQINAGAAGKAATPGSYPLGILFVHGIGDQQQGATLGTWGSALTRWLRGWLGGRRAKVGLYKAPDEHTELRVSTPGEDRTWLLAESWWAQLISAPRIGELGSWLARVAPWLAIAQVWPHTRYRFKQLTRGALAHEPWYEQLSRLLRALVSLLLLAAMMPLATMLVIAVWLVLLALRLPLPGWRARTERFARAVAASLGDSYLLVQDPLQYDRMRSKVRKDVKSLAGKCDRVAVVAHSQGAALAHDVLKELASGPAADKATAGKVRLLATVGSGIWKLTRLRDLLYGVQRGVTLAPVWGLLLMTTAMGVAVFSDKGAPWLPLNLQSLMNWPAAPQWAVVGLVLLAGAGLLTVGLWSTFKTFKKSGAFDLPKGFHSSFRWVDYWATADPVPNGPLVDWAEEPKKINGTTLPCTRKLYNTASLLRDHSAYARNYDQFWPLLAGELFDADDCGYWGRCASAQKEQIVKIIPVPGQSAEEAMPAWCQRRNRVRWLAFARTAAAVLAALALVTAPGARVNLGRSVLAACAGAALLPDGMQHACSGQLAAGGEAVGQQPPDLAWYEQWVVMIREDPAAIGGMTLAAAVLLAYVGLRALWRSWQRRADEVVVHKRHTAKLGMQGWAFGALCVALFGAVIAAVVGIPGGAGRWIAALAAVWIGFYFVLQAADTRSACRERSAPAASEDP